MTPNPTPNILLLRLMKALISEPEKLVPSRDDARDLTVHTWAKDHARLVGKGGETIYALRKLGEYMGLRLTLADPLHDIDAAVKPRPEFEALETVKALHAAAGDKAHIERDEIEGMTMIAVTATGLQPDFCRAVTLLFRKIGTISKHPIEVVYE